MPGEAKAVRVWCIAWGHDSALVLPTVALSRKVAWRLWARVFTDPNRAPREQFRAVRCTLTVDAPRRGR